MASACLTGYKHRMKEYKATERKISIVPVLAETLLGWVSAFVFGFFVSPVSIIM